LERGDSGDIPHALHEVGAASVRSDPDFEGVNATVDEIAVAVLLSQANNMDNHSDNCDRDAQHNGKQHPKPPAYVFVLIFHCTCHQTVSAFRACHETCAGCKSCRAKTVVGKHSPGCARPMCAAAEHAFILSSISCPSDGVKGNSCAAKEMQGRTEDQQTGASPLLLAGLGRIVIKLENDVLILRFVRIAWEDILILGRRACDAAPVGSPRLVGTLRRGMHLAAGLSA
jgi:hypothetical protein